MFCAVSLYTPPLCPMLTAIMGGFGETKVKALKGARLTAPVADKVVIQAMGRGTTIPVSSLYISSAPSSCGRMCIADP